MKSSHHDSEAETSDNGHNWTKVQFPDEPCKINIVWSTVFKHRKAHLWCIDTGANVAVTSPTDSEAIDVQWMNRKLYSLQAVFNLSVLVTLQ